MPSWKEVNAVKKVPTFVLVGSAARLLYGNRWQRQLAALLGITTQAMVFWRLKRNEPKPEHFDKIIDLIDRQTADLRNARVHLMIRRNSLRKRHEKVIKPKRKVTLWEIVKRQRMEREQAAKAAQ